MKVVLHICCGVCAAGVAETLAGEGHQVIGFFYNPNIHPEEEYQKRLDVARRVAKELRFPLEVGDYETEKWFQLTEALTEEPEGGRRCLVCYRMRLTKAHDYMISCGADTFTTTLTVSPHKQAKIINDVGLEIGGQKFLVRDFKKKDGFKRTIQLAKKWELYRQDYCGCIYSIK